MPVLQLEKTSERQLDSSVMRKQLEYVIRRALSGGRGKTWGYVGPKTPKIQDETTELGNSYLVKLKFDRTGRSCSDSIKEQQWQVIQEMAEKAAWSKGGWAPVGKKTEGDQTPSEQVRQYVNPQMLAGHMNEASDPHFAHLFDREAQIAIIRSAIEAFIESGYEERFHAILYGPPACGKTDILRSFTRYLGSDAVLHFDATSTTKAGAEKVLLETKHIPPILMVEEVEKCEEASLRWLLGVLDHRGEIRKVNFRTGLTAQRNVQLLCLATVNDLELFKRVMDGALASRFAHKVYCPRPNRDILEKILVREISLHKGNSAWVNPALDWCLDEEKTTDPRRVIAVCMSGKDKLLDGTYQNYLRKTMEP